jgi:hypothetical protein
VERIDEVDAEVDGMLDGWRGVEEGGKSLKDACERLLEERVRVLDPVRFLSQMFLGKIFRIGYLK